MKKKKPRGKVRLIPGKCIACGDRCLAVCSLGAIEMNEKGEPIIIVEKCFGCRKCIKECPVDAFEIYFTPEEELILKEWKDEPVPQTAPAEKPPGVKAEKTPKGIKLWKGVWIFVEQIQGEAHTVAWELLGKGKELARELGVELSAFVLGEDIKHLATEAFGYGADNVYLMEHPVLKHYRTKAYLHGTVELIRKYKPEIVLMGATGLGRDLAGAVATELTTGLTADCTGLSIEPDLRILEQTRPAFGGNIMATILTETERPQMASVRPHVMTKPEFQAERSGKLIKEPFTLDEDEIPTKVLEVITSTSKTRVNIEGANILVSGGRGLMNKENFKMLQEFADLIGGVMSGSRCAVDEGFITHDRQVGQTGKTVRPKLYIACAISGAIQHMVGMQGSEYIIAINKDKSAPIFEIAHLGIVGDVFEIIPALIEKIKQTDAKAVV